MSVFCNKAKYTFYCIIKAYLKLLKNIVYIFFALFKIKHGFFTKLHLFVGLPANKCKVCKQKHIFKIVVTFLLSKNEKVHRPYIQRPTMNFLQKSFYHTLTSPYFIYTRIHMYKLKSKK